jgi:branched-chain amino acid transport system ATP-binding protein
LSTRGLDKRFGSLVVASGVGISLPQGARYALIGPNGAGKTTLINLITGMLRPDAGSIHLGERDITALKPNQRVKLGLVRTFQINTLFSQLSALEAVALAVCERRGVAGNFWQRLPAFSDAVDEAQSILKSLSLGADATRLTRELAYGQQRLLEIALALATQPKVLLLDEPAAGVPRDESGELFAAIAGLSKDITVLFIGQIWTSCSASRPASSSSWRVPSWSRARRRRSRPTGACARSISAGRAMAEDLLTLDGVRAGYGEAVVLDDVSLKLPPNGSLAVLGRNGVGKSTLLLTIMGLTQVMRGRIVWRGAEITSLAPHRRARAGLGWVAQEREIFPSLTVEENLTVAARPGRWHLDAVYQLFPRLAERSSNMGNQLSGGEQQMLAIARALTTNPALLLLDEPLEGLAPIIVEELAGAIRRMLGEEGTAVILVEQHAELALSLARDAVVMERGAIVHRAASAQLLGDAATLDRYIGLKIGETAG